MWRKNEFNLDEFEKRILQMEVRIQFEFDQLIINRSLNKC